MRCQNLIECSPDNGQTHLRLCKRRAVGGIFCETCLFALEAECRRLLLGRLEFLLGGRIVARKQSERAA
jgi:hypothetical protein